MLYKPYAWAVIIGIVAGLAVWYWQSRPPDVSILQPADLQDTAKLQKELDISKKEAEALKEEIAKVSARPPVISYTVNAQTPSDAAKIVSKQIKEDSVPVPLPPADKTIVTPQDTKVDVYRINLRKDNGIGVYVSSESIGAIVQHKNVTVFGGPKYDGGYEIGAGYMVRW